MIEHAAQALVAAALAVAPAGVAGPVTAMPSLAGGRAAFVDARGCQPGMVLVGRAYCVDLYEGSLAAIGPDGARTPHPAWERPVAGVTYAAVSAPGLLPQGYVSRVEAEAACGAVGKRLCGMKEWQRACRQKGFARWPYGNTGKRGACNTGKTHLLTELFKNPPGGMKYDEHFNSPELARTPGYLALTGAHPECRTELGVADMVGNLHEWVRGTVDQELADEVHSGEVERRKQPWREGNGIFLGGFYSTTSELGPGCDYITIAHEPGYHDYSTGFRCCADAKVAPGFGKEARRP